MGSECIEKENKMIYIYSCKYIDDNGYKNNFSSVRHHHEIYLSDARKVAQEKWKTVIRHPIVKK